MTTFFNHKNSFFIGSVAGATVYGINLFTSPAIIYMANFVVGSALISLLGPVAAAAMGWTLPFIAALAMGGLVAWLTSSLINMLSTEKQGGVGYDTSPLNSPREENDLQGLQQPGLIAH